MRLGKEGQEKQFHNLAICEYWKSDFLSLKKNYQCLFYFIFLPGLTGMGMPVVIRQKYYIEAVVEKLQDSRLGQAHYLLH